MNRILTLSLIAIIALGMGGCKKRKARKTMTGSWEITEYEGYFEDACDGGTYYDWDFDENFGTVVFDKKTVVMNYELFEDDDNCYTESSSTLSGDYKVTDHDRELLVLHTYDVDINGDLWQVRFEDDFSAASKADGQDIMILEKVLNPEESIWLRMLRTN